MSWWKWLMDFLDSAGVQPALPEPSTLEYRNAKWRGEWMQKYYELEGQ